jgi:hypothetical protein
MSASTASAQPRFACPIRAASSRVPRCRDHIAAPKATSWLTEEPCTHLIRRARRDRFSGARDRLV